MPAPYDSLVFNGWPMAGPLTITSQWLQVIAENGGKPHMGLDLTADPAVLARGDHWPIYYRGTVPGKAVDFNNGGDFGKDAVCIDILGTRWYSLYAHGSSRLVFPGQDVQPGQLIAYSGGAGASGMFTYGEHLHWQCNDSTTFSRDVDHNANPADFMLPALFEVISGTDIRWAREIAAAVQVPDPADLLPGVAMTDPLTRAQVELLVNRMLDRGILAGSEEVLSCLEQISGVTPNTFTAADRIAAVRAAIVDR